MKNSELIKALVSREWDDEYFHAAHLVAVLLPKHLDDTLQQLVNGPIWDGDVISKTYRDELLEYELAVRVCKGGSQGYTGATYFAYTVNNIIAAGRSKLKLKR